MTFSMEQVKIMLKEQNEFDSNNMGFLLTVLRDNCIDDDLHKFLAECILIVQEN